MWDNELLIVLHANFFNFNYIFFYKHLSYSTKRLFECFLRREFIDKTILLIVSTTLLKKCCDNLVCTFQWTQLWTPPRLSFGNSVEPNEIQILCYSWINVFLGYSPSRSIGYDYIHLFDCPPNNGLKASLFLNNICTKIHAFTMSVYPVVFFLLFISKKNWTYFRLNRIYLPILKAVTLW